MHSIDAELQVDGCSLVVNCKKETKLLHLECSKKKKKNCSRLKVSAGDIFLSYFCFIFVCICLPTHISLSLSRLSVSGSAGAMLPKGGAGAV